jgi:arylsulfatase A-like enzyme
MMSDQPNLIFVFSDQHRGSALGCAGNEQVDTPTMDRLAREGARFETACANTPVCTTSRASLLTGQYPLSHRTIANDLQLPTDVPSVARAFQDAGYRTGYVGKWHLDGLPRDRFTPPGPRRQGFDDFWAVWNCSHHYENAHYYRDTADPIPVDGYEPITQTDLALEFLRNDDERPFCLFLSWGPPHAPYQMVPDRYREHYDPESIELRPNAEPIPPERSHIGSDLDPHETLAGYYAHITALDDQLERLLDGLDAAGISQETIVTYTSDHGDMLWSQGTFKKEQPWIESVHVPFIVRYPDAIPGGTEIEAPIGIVDAAPTMLDLADVDIPTAMQGESYAAAIRGDGDPPRDDVFLAEIVRNSQARGQHLPPWRGVKTDRYTYVRLRDGRPWLLYDEQVDPYQQHNLVFDPDYESVLDRLDTRLDAWLEQTNDPFTEEADHLRQVGRVNDWNEKVEQMGAFTEQDSISTEEE